MIRALEYLFIAVLLYYAYERAGLPIAALFFYLIVTNELQGFALKLLVKRTRR